MAGPKVSARGFSKDLDAFDDWFDSLDQNDTYKSKRHVRIMSSKRGTRSIDDGYSDSSDEEKVYKKEAPSRGVNRKASGALEQMMMQSKKDSASSVPSGSSNNSTGMLEGATKKRALSIFNRRRASEAKGKARRAAVTSTLSSILGDSSHHNDDNKSVHTTKTTASSNQNRSSSAPPLRRRGDASPIAKRGGKKKVTTPTGGKKGTKKIVVNANSPKKKKKATGEGGDEAATSTPKRKKKSIGANHGDEAASTPRKGKKKPAALKKQGSQNTVDSMDADEPTGKELVSTPRRGKKVKPATLTKQSSQNTVNSKDDTSHGEEENSPLPKMKGKRATTPKRQDSLKKKGSQQQQEASQQDTTPRKKKKPTSPTHKPSDPQSSFTSNTVSSTEGSVVSAADAKVNKNNRLPTIPAITPETPLAKENRLQVPVLVPSVTPASTKGKKDTADSKSGQGLTRRRSLDSFSGKDDNQGAESSSGRHNHHFPTRRRSNEGLVGWDSGRSPRAGGHRPPVTRKRSNERGKRRGDELSQSDHGVTTRRHMQMQIGGQRTPITRKRSLEKGRQRRGGGRDLLSQSEHGMLLHHLDQYYEHDDQHDSPTKNCPKVAIGLAKNKIGGGQDIHKKPYKPDSTKEFSVCSPRQATITSANEAAQVPDLTQSQHFNFLHSLDQMYEHDEAPAVPSLDIPSLENDKGLGDSFEIDPLMAFSTHQSTSQQGKQEPQVDPIMGFSHHSSTQEPRQEALIDPIMGFSHHSTTQQQEQLPIDPITGFSHHSTQPPPPPPPPPQIDPIVGLSSHHGSSHQYDDTEQVVEGQGEPEQPKSPRSSKSSHGNHAMRRPSRGRRRERSLSDTRRRAENGELTAAPPVVTKAEREGSTPHPRASRGDLPPLSGQTTPKGRRGRSQSITRGRKGDESSQTVEASKEPTRESRSSANTPRRRRDRSVSVTRQNSKEMPKIEIRKIDTADPVVSPKIETHDRHSRGRPPVTGQNPTPRTRRERSVSVSRKPAPSFSDDASADASLDDVSISDAEETASLASERLHVKDRQPLPGQNASSDDDASVDISVDVSISDAEETASVELEKAEQSSARGRPPVTSQTARPRRRRSTSVSRRTSAEEGAGKTIGETETKRSSTPVRVHRSMSRGRRRRTDPGDGSERSHSVGPRRAADVISFESKRRSQSIGALRREQTKRRSRRDQLQARISNALTPDTAGDASGDEAKPKSFVIKEISF